MNYDQKISTNFFFDCQGVDRYMTSGYTDLDLLCPLTELALCSPASSKDLGKSNIWSGFDVHCE